MSTTFVPAICTQCSGEMTVDPSLEKAYCQYCGTTFLVENAINSYNVQQANIEHIETVNIHHNHNQQGFLDSIFSFVEKQQVRKDEKKRLEEEKKKRDDKVSLIVLLILIPILILSFVFLGANDEELMKQYLYNFWLTRNNTNPEKEWKEYKERVDITQDLYSTSIKRGYETDRGRVYLKYGKPNTISEMKNEPSSYPYEIWHYYGTENRSNVKFIFYNPDIISNDYPLLHSTMQGEIYNTQWRVDLHKRTNPIRDIDQTDPRNYTLDRTEEYFALPK